MQNPYQLTQLAYDAGFTRDSNELTQAVAAAIGESGGNERAVGDGGKSFGLWQIYIPAHPEYANNPQALFNPRTNAAAAHKIFVDAGNKFEPFHALSHASAAKRAALMTAAAAGVTLWMASHPGAAFGLQAKPPAAVQEAVGGLTPDLAGITEPIKRAGQWLSTPANIGRVAIAVGGVIVVIAGLIVLMRPALEEGIKVAGAVKP